MRKIEAVKIEMRGKTMAHNYGILRGATGKAKRCGDKESGITSELAGPEGAIKTHVYYDEVLRLDMVKVEMVPWIPPGGGWKGCHHTLYEGPLGRSNMLPPRFKLKEIKARPTIRISNDGDGHGLPLSLKIDWRGFRVWLSLTGWVLVESYSRPLYQRHVEWHRADLYNTKDVKNGEGVYTVSAIKLKANRWA